jgi:hypothetical protein
MSRFHLQSCRLRQGGLPRIKGEELFRAERNRQSDVQQVETANTQVFRVCGSEVFRLPEGVGPRDGGVGQNGVGEISINLAQGLLALLDGDFSPEDAQTNGIAQFVPMEGSEGQSLAGFQQIASPRMAWVHTFPPR